MGCCCACPASCLRCFTAAAPGRCHFLRAFTCPALPLLAPSLPPRRLFSVLRPGGRLLITDYCKAEGKQPSEGFAAYIQQRGYDLHSLEVRADEGRCWGLC